MNRRLPPFSASHLRPSPRPPPIPLATLETLLAYEPSSFTPHQCPAYLELVRRFVGSQSNHPIAAETLHLNLIKQGLSADLFLSNNLITHYHKSGNLENAHKVFDEIPHKNVVTWTSLIAGYSNGGLYNEAFGLFVSALSSGNKPSQYTFGGVLRACQDGGGLRLGRQMHGLVSKNGVSVEYCGL